ncbi:MAG: septum formation protein Maf [Saprospiraceae bacterium]|jgi:septum formation protein|nr:septum formation protein Maf [Saprospiraceae bacterium]
MTDASRYPRIVLGSKSPRRYQLLSDSGFDVEVRTQEDEEDFDINMPVNEVAEMLAVRKADAIKGTLKPNEILITADSVVILGEKIYNKPADYDEAVKILTALGGKQHTVITGVCVMSMESMNSFSVSTLVTFDQMTSEEIDYYITNYKPYDKAGAYGIQDWIGLCKVKEINGSYSNIMGLPMRELYQALIKFGVTL